MLIHPVQNVSFIAFGLLVASDLVQFSYMLFLEPMKLLEG